MVGEVALAVVLTLGAGLLVRSFRELTQVDPGFDPHGVLATQIVLSGPKYDSASQKRVFFDQFIARVAALPPPADRDLRGGRRGGGGALVCPRVAPDR